MGQYFVWKLIYSPLTNIWQWSTSMLHEFAGFDFFVLGVTKGRHDLEWLWTTKDII